jgi:carbamoyltransferase
MSVGMSDYNLRIKNPSVLRPVFCVSEEKNKSAMYTLGINAAFHDSAACIVHDGKLLAAAEEERFTHVKHGKRPVPFSTYELPFHAIDYCLSVAGIHINHIDNVGYSFNPRKMPGSQQDGNFVQLPLNIQSEKGSGDGSSIWDPLFLSMIVNAPGQLRDGYPHHLQKRFSGATVSDKQWHFVDHHLSHAASAFLPSPFADAAVWTIDGRGENTTTSYYLGHDQDLSMMSEVKMPHSLGLLYEKITSHLGFLHSSDEYKVMALASYGRPQYVDEFRSIIRLGTQGKYEVDDFQADDLFGPRRLRGEPFGERHFNIAHSLQRVLQERVIELAGWLSQETQGGNLCLAGGVALNCVLNGSLRDSGLFRNIWIQPAAGDAGTALGAALWVDARQRKGKRNFSMDHPYWGPSFTDDEIEKFLKWTKVPYRKMSNVAQETASLLADNKIIGWYQGRMEFGPRALGGRSILASPIQAEMQSRLNDIKDREDFRPVAPVVVEEDAAEWFEQGDYSPFMLFVYPVRKDKEDLIPAVKHVDGTARVQTVNRNQHPLYYDLLQEFKKLTGVPVLVNTSFNTRGEPIVCTPRDAIECFWTSPIDALAIGSFLLTKDGV